MITPIPPMILTVMNRATGTIIKMAKRCTRMILFNITSNKDQWLRRLKHNYSLRLLYHPRRYLCLCLYLVNLHLLTVFHLLSLPLRPR